MVTFLQRDNYSSAYETQVSRVIFHEHREENQMTGKDPNITLDSFNYSLLFQNCWQSSITKEPYMLYSTDHNIGGLRH